jgi:uncharacterized protein YjbI with pentapeptide repeats
VVDEQRRPWGRTAALIRRALAIAGVVLLLAGFVWLWWQGVPALYRTAGSGQDVENVRLNAVTTTRAALLAGFVGLGALGTFWLNSRVYGITARTFELTERGHLTDRYSKAIEQLGNDSLDVRLGGIYSLEQIAHDSRRDRDQTTIVEVLSAFVRVHSAPLYQYKASLSEGAVPEPADEQRQKAIEYVTELDRPPVDVQAAVSVLGRLPNRSGPSVDVGADLTKAWLRRATLIWADLAEATLDGADLAEADLYGATLTKVRLGGATLTEATLDEATLSEATLHTANLTKATLDEANLTEANLYEATLTKANLTGANLTEARLTGATLTEANLYEATLSEATLHSANLTKANLDGANLTKARLTGANLTKANLYEANLTKATLHSANLTGAVHLVQEQVDVAFGYKDTLLPAGLRRPESWNRGEAPESD